MIRPQKLLIFTTSQKNFLRTLAQRNGVWFDAKTNVGKFIESYIIAEAIARRLIFINSKKPCPPTLNFTSIRSASKSFDITRSISVDLIEDIFSGNNRNGRKTPRQLRNGIVHEISNISLIEIESRIHELTILINSWIDCFKKLN
jgi:hypothetical protein